MPFVAGRRLGDAPFYALKRAASKRVDARLTRKLKGRRRLGVQPGRIPFDMGNRHAGKTGGGSLALGPRAPAVRRGPVLQRALDLPPSSLLLHHFHNFVRRLGNALVPGRPQARRGGGPLLFRYRRLVTSGIHDVGGVFGPSSFLCSFSCASLREISRDCSSCFFLRLAFASAAKSLCKTSARSLRRSAAAKSRRLRNAPVSAVRGRDTGRRLDREGLLEVLELATGRLRSQVRHGPPVERTERRSMYFCASKFRRWSRCSAFTRPSVFVA